LPIVIPLPVSAATKSGLGEDPVFDFALLFQRNLVFKYVQFRSEMAGNPITQLHLPVTITDFQRCFPLILNSRRAISLGASKSHSASSN
jgi:hypothetical protein